MPRINVEDELWKDERVIAMFDRLGRFKALGCVLVAWKLAQGFWVRDKLVPEEHWKISGLPECLFEFGLAQHCPDGIRLKDGTDMAPGIHVRGSETQFAWLRSKIKNGARGGLARAKNAKNYRKLQSGIPQNALLNESTHLQEATASDSNPLPLTLTLKTKKKNSSTSGRTVACRFDLEAAYANYPRKEGKSPGMKTLAREVKLETDYWDLLIAIENYSKAETVKKGFVKLFSTFAKEWRDWVDPETGRVVRTTENRQLELNSFADIEAVGEPYPSETPR